MAVLALCAGLTAGVCGCNNARMVRWDGSTGVVAIPRNDNVWPESNRDHAEELMRQCCPHGYQVVSEEEVVVGQVQHTHVNTDRTGDPTLAALHIAPVSTRTNETMMIEDKKEWRITFRPNDVRPVVVNTPQVIQTGAFVPATLPRPAAVVTQPTPPGLPSQPVPVAPPPAALVTPQAPIVLPSQPATLQQPAAPAATTTANSLPSVPVPVAPPPAATVAPAAPVSLPPLPMPEAP
jgi:hypothetical protein